MLLKYLLAVVAVYGQSAWLVKDVAGTTVASSTPRGAVRMGNAIYSMVTTPRPALWKFDLATRRSSVVREFTTTQVSDTNSLVAVNNRLIFTAPEAGAWAIWASDGTSAGTTAIAPNVQLPINDSIQPPVVVGGYLYASAYSTTSGANLGLWRTNGTVAGTGPVKPGTPLSARGIAELGGEVYFTARNDVDSTYRLWRSDGTAAGTTEVVGPGQGLNYVGFMRRVGSKLIFEAGTNSSGQELWVSDGTPSGTSLLSDFQPGSGSFSPTLLQAHAGFMYFYLRPNANDRELWKTDGTAAGTSLVKAINPGFGFTTISPSTASANGYLFFLVQQACCAFQLYRSDGTDAGTFPLTWTATETLTANEDGSAVFFARNDGASGSELWKSDGTAAGTALVKDVCAGSCSSIPWLMRTTASGKSYFRASTPGSGEELWETDGTAAGTVLAADMNTGDAGSQPRAMVEFGGNHYYTTIDGERQVSLWRTDGTQAGTVLVKALYQGTQPTYLHVVNGALVFVGNRDAVPQVQLWVSDGTAAGTNVVQVHDYYSGGGFVSGNKLFYSIFSSGSQQLWTSDGTVAGTSSSSGAIPRGYLEGSRVAALPGGRIVFEACGLTGPGGTRDCEPWVSDGTAPGTALLANTFVGGDGNPGGFVTVGSWVFFRSNNSLWKTDGTGTFTSQVSPITGIAGPWAAVGSEVLFQALGSLYKSDGTAAGTVPIASSVSPAIGSIGFRSDFGVLPGRMLFQGFASGLGTELWSTDGTAAGTLLVKDIYPGANSSQIREFRSTGSHLFFSACDGSSGCEPWVSDGTPAGTKRVADIAPGGALSSDPVMLAAAPGGRMYMSASHPLRGHELWLADPASCAVPAVVTSQMTVTAGVPVFNRNTGRFVQSVSIRNNGGAVDGVAYVLSGLNAASTVVNSHGVTHCFAPVGAAYRDVGAIGAGQTVTVTLEISAAVGTPLTYMPKVISALDGPR